MKLGAPQQQALKRERGICADEVCDKCRNILGAVRYTLRNEQGEWCSQECRDGKADSQEREARIARSAGRPRLSLSGTARVARRRAQIREAAQRRRNVIKNRLHPIENTHLAGAILASGYGDSQNASACVLEALK